MSRTERFFDTALQQLSYTVSLPERTVRSLAALAGGTSTLLAETLFPEALRRTTTYNITIGMMQRFVIEQVAGIESEAVKAQAKLKQDYIQRKMAGTALEAAGLLTMGFSPLWVLAIAADAAGGSKLFLRRLVKHLDANNVATGATDATELVDVLEAIQRASSMSATTIDMPPLSRADLTQLADEMKSSYARVFEGMIDLMPRLDGIWKSMEQLARRENISVVRLAGIMTVAGLSWRKKGTNMARSVARAGAELFDENILVSYKKTLALASEQGVEKFMSSHMRPFWQAARSHFDPAQQSWTESKLSGEGKAGKTSEGESD